MIWLHLCDNLVAGPVIFLHVYPMTHADNPHPLQPGLKGEPIADRSEEGRATERSKELDAQIASDKEEPICSRKHKEEPIRSGKQPWKLCTAPCCFQEFQKERG